MITDISIVIHVSHVWQGQSLTFYLLICFSTDCKYTSVYLNKKDIYAYEYRGYNFVLIDEKHLNMYDIRFI